MSQERQQSRVDAGKAIACRAAPCLGIREDHPSGRDDEREQTAQEHAGTQEGAPEPGPARPGVRFSAWRGGVMAVDWKSSAAFTRLGSPGPDRTKPASNATRSTPARRNDTTPSGVSAPPATRIGCSPKRSRSRRAVRRRQWGQVPRYDNCVLRTEHATHRCPHSKQRGMNGRSRIPAAR